MPRITERGGRSKVRMIVERNKIPAKFIQLMLVAIEIPGNNTRIGRQEIFI